jgi:hypothetical protein
VFGGLTSILIAPWLDCASLLFRAISRAANVGFLRLATLALAQALDLATFGVMVGRHGASAEANPIVNDLFGALGMPAVIIVKLILVLLVGALSVAAMSQGGRGTWAIVGGLPIALAITAGIIGGITNAAVILG